jgi:hypothetical protein
LNCVVPGLVDRILVVKRAEFLADACYVSNCYQGGQTDIQNDRLVRTLLMIRMILNPSNSPGTDILFLAPMLLFISILSLKVIEEAHIRIHMEGPKVQRRNFQILLKVDAFTCAVRITRWVTPLVESLVTKSNEVVRILLLDVCRDILCPVGDRRAGGDA